MRIGITTGGGDCAGLNAVIWSAVKTAVLEYGDEVVGLPDGFDALILKNDPIELGLKQVRGKLREGGTMLGTTNRGNPFSYVLPGSDEPRDCSDHVVRRVESLGLDGLVVIGGDGTMSIAHGLAEKGVPIVGVPKTIDNDLQATDYTFGFDTAVNFAMDGLDRLRTTAASHERVMIMEVMGRNAGWIALHSGVAGGAHAILLPEVPYDCQALVKHIRRQFVRSNFYLIVISEGAVEAGGGRSVVEGANASRVERLGGAGHRLAEALREHIDHEIRVTVLGHLQRGGSPTAFDRALSVRFGREAVRLIHEKKFGHMVALKGTEIEPVTLAAAVGGERLVSSDNHLLSVARSIGVCLGESEDA